MKKLYQIVSFLLLSFTFLSQAHQNQIKPNTDMFWDIHYTDMRAINQWFRVGFDSNQRNEFGQSLLIKAVIKENKLVVKKLLSFGIDVNIVDKFGKTALDYAVQQENKALARMLIAKKAKVTTDFNAIRCRELTVKRSGWRVFGALLTGIIGLGLIACGGMVLMFLVVLPGKASTAYLTASLVVSTIVLCGVGVTYGSVKLAKNKEPGVCIARL